MTATRINVPDLKVGDHVRVAGHTLRITERTAHGAVVNCATVLVTSDADADPFVIGAMRNATYYDDGGKCECGRECDGWHIQGNALATAALVEPLTCSPGFTCGEHPSDMYCGKRLSESLPPF